MELRKVAETDTTITLGWDAQPSADGYRFYADGKPVSRTFDPARTTVRFAKGAAEYKVEVLKVSAGDSGVYPPVATPPPPATTMTPAQLEAALAVDGAVVDNVFVSGASVSVRGANTTLRNSRLDDVVLDIESSANGFSLLDSEITRGGFNVWGASNVAIERNSLDGGGLVSSNQMWDSDGAHTDGFVIRGNTISNYRGADCLTHGEGLFIGGKVSNGLIEGNTFENNGCTSHIFFSYWGDAAYRGEDPSTTLPHDICVRGNTFGPRYMETYFDVNFRDEVVAAGPDATRIKVQPDAVTTNTEFNAAC